MSKTAKLIPILVTVSLLCVGMNQIAPQTVVLQHDNQFWLLDLATRSQRLILDPYLEPDAVLGHSYLSPDGKYLYFLVFHDQERHMPTQLRQFEIMSGETRTIFESAGLSQMSPVSPDGRFTALGQRVVTETSETWVQCLFEISSQTCIPLDLRIHYRNTHWIDTESFLTSSDDMVEKATLSLGMTLKNHSVTHEGWWFRYGDLTSDERTLIINVTYPADRNYAQALVAMDTASLDILWDYVLEDKPGAAVSGVDVSPDDRLVAVKRGLYLEVIDLASGSRIAELEAVLQVVWVLIADISS